MLYLRMISSDLKLFTKSLDFAARKHISQRRKNGDFPYINHPIEVANILAQAGINDYDVLCAAILHDTVQDTQTSPEQLEQQFGAKIKNIVLECSDDKNLSKSQRKRHQITHSSAISNQAKLVKIADKLSNNHDLLRLPPQSWGPQRVKGYFIWSNAVCNSLRGVNEVLDGKLDELFKKAGVSELSEQEKKQKLQKYIESLKE